MAALGFSALPYFLVFDTLSAGCARRACRSR
jgi:hypothetical protein